MQQTLDPFLSSILALPPQKLHSGWKLGLRKRDLESELSSLLGYEGDLLLPALLLVAVRTFVNIPLAILQHSIDESCEAVSHGSNGLWGTQFSS